MCAEALNNASMKEIKGLDERLNGLQQLLEMVQTLKQSQAEMAQVSTSSMLMQALCLYLVKPSFKWTKNILSFKPLVEIQYLKGSFILRVCVFRYGISQ